MTGNSSNGAYKKIPVNSDEISEQTKILIGRLLIVCSGETEPARRLHFMSALISHVRSAVRMIMMKSQTPEFADIVEELITNLLAVDTDPKVTAVALARLRKHLENFPRTRYDISIFNDVALIQQCRERWHLSNRFYHGNENAWEQSDAILTDLLDAVADIAARWNLVVLPKNVDFDISALTQRFTQTKEPHHDQE